MEPQCVYLALNLPRIRPRIYSTRSHSFLLRKSRVNTRALVNINPSEKGEEKDIFSLLTPRLAFLPKVGFLRCLVQGSV